MGGVTGESSTCIFDYSIGGDSHLKALNTFTYSLTENSIIDTMMSHSIGNDIFVLSSS